MPTTIGTIPELITPDEITCEVYTSGGVVLFIQGPEDAAYKFRMDEARWRKMIEYLAIAGRYYGYTSNWLGDKEEPECSQNPTPTE